MANPLASSTSTATSALGHLLTKGTFLAAGIHGTTPSGSSAHFSVDIGSIHIAALSTHSPVGTELAWLEADLAAAAANRKAVPWIIVTSHYPIFLSTMAEHANASSARWHAIEGELVKMQNHVIENETRENGVPNLIEVDASRSEDHDGTIVTYSFRVLDRDTELMVYQAGPQASPKTTFWLVPGEYLVWVTVVDNDGSSHSETRRANVRD